MGYGNTETFTITSGFPAIRRRKLRADSHGAALPGNTLKIVDPADRRRRSARRARGDRVKGPTLMLGYLGIPLDETLDDEGFLSYWRRRLHG